MSSSPIQIAEGMLKIFQTGNESTADTLLRSAFDSFTSLPVDVWVVAKDFFDADNRGLNERERIRLAELIKRGVSSEDFRRLMYIVVSRYVSGLTDEQVGKILVKLAGSRLGNAAFKTFFSSELASWFGTYLIPRFLLSAKITGMLGVGAMVSRSIYSSRNLKELNETIYYALRNAGDLDLLYFMVEDVLEPWVEAINYITSNKMLSQEIFEHFLEKAPRL